MAGTYRYLVADIKSGELLDDLPLAGAAFTHVLNEPGELNASIQWRHPKHTRANLAANRRKLYVERDGRIVKGTWLRWGRRPIGSDVAQLHARGLLDYFGHRKLRVTRTYSQTDQLAIARDLIDWAQDQPGGNIGVALGAETSGRLRDETFHGYERREILAIVAGLAARIDGFDYDIESSWVTKDVEIEDRLRLYYPRRGRRTEHVFDLDVNVADYGWAEDGIPQATLVDAVGQGEGDDMLIATAADPNLWGSYPVTERTVAHKDVSSLATLQEHADAELQAGRLPFEIPSIRVRADRSPIYSSYIAGDEVTVRLTDGPLAYSELKRIRDYEVTVGDNGEESVLINFVSPATAGL